MPIKPNTIKAPQSVTTEVVVVEERVPYVPNPDEITFVEENGKKYAFDLTGDIANHSDLSLYEVEEDGSIGKELLSMFSNGGHCGVTFGANGDAEGVPGLSFEDLTNFLAILTKIYKDTPLKFLYM